MIISSITTIMENFDKDDNNDDGPTRKSANSRQNQIKGLRWK